MVASKKNRLETLFLKNNQISTQLQTYKLGWFLHLLPLIMHTVKLIHLKILNYMQKLYIYLTSVLIKGKRPWLLSYRYKKCCNFKDRIQETKKV